MTINEQRFCGNMTADGNMATDHGRIPHRVRATDGTLRWHSDGADSLRPEAAKGRWKICFPPFPPPPPASPAPLYPPPPVPPPSPPPPQLELPATSGAELAQMLLQ
eukprot:6196368-Prymnesium_polylepis.1